MELKLDKRFWVVITCIIVVFTIFYRGTKSVARHRDQKDIATLEREREIYRTRIEQDSTLLEELSTTIIWSSSPASVIACSVGGESLYRGMKRLSRRVERVLKIWGVS